MKKKYLIILIAILLFFSKKTHAYSKEFQSMIEEKEIPITNLYGNAINEEIYQKYHLFVYGSPTKVYNNQRWKNKEDGFWNNQINSQNCQGEYLILGENYSGGAVYNPDFPMDIADESHLKWQYVHLAGSEFSWQNLIEANSENQKEYMLTKELFKENVSTSITAKEIGMDKAKIEKAATWQTAGSIYTKKSNQEGVELYEIYTVPPISPNASLESFLFLKEAPQYVVEDEKTKMILTLCYGAKVSNLSNYASNKDVKTIQSFLYQNGEKIDSISQAQVYENRREYQIVIEANEEGKFDYQAIHLRCSSFLSTYFMVDGLLKSTVDAELTLLIGEQLLEDEIPPEEQSHFIDVKPTIEKTGDKAPPRISQIEIKRVVLDSSGKESYVDLLKSKRYGIGFICAGQELYIRVKTVYEADEITFSIEGDSSIQTIDEKTRQFELTDPKRRGISSNILTEFSLKKMYRLPQKMTLEKEDESENVKYFSVRYIVPYGTKQTLHSWNTLREKYRSAFEVSEEELFERIRNPYRLYFKVSSENGTTTKYQAIDIFETWNTIYNRDLTPYTK